MSARFIFQPVYTPGDEEWTPYTQNALIGSPILPAYGLEQYGLTIPRRNAEAWRHFDVVGLVGTDYSCTPLDTGKDLDIDEDKANKYIETLKSKGAWIDDGECNGRLVYINGRFTPSLSCVSDIAKNMCANDFNSGNVKEDVVEKMNRLTDGFTDKLAADVPSGETDFLTSLKTLSGPDHAVGEPTSQFSINSQQGTACFVALNSVRAGSVAYVDVPNEYESKPVLVVNAITKDGGVLESNDEKGVAIHPRAFVNAGSNSKVSFIQSYVDFDEADDVDFNQKLVNGCTQIYVGSGANVTHSYLEETGGIVTGGVETPSEDEEEGVEPKKDIESKRDALRDTHFEAIDVHVVGEDGSYEVAALCVGGNGKSRVSVGTSLLKPGAHATVNGFSLAGGAQRSDFRTFIHHVAQATTSRQSQKNMVGGKATSSFRGRIRVEQSAQQTDSEQLARTILLSDKAKIWATPSLEIIADDVMCTHGATVSDLSEEELFYLRSRGMDKITARNMLMYGFVDEIGSCVDDSIQGDKDDHSSLKNRVVKRLQNVVPQGDRAIKGEFQSS
jgi:Fe-S cluster assembly scaffold protein SufB